MVMGWGCPLFQSQKIHAGAEYNFWTNHQLNLVGHNRWVHSKFRTATEAGLLKKSRLFLAAIKTPQAV